MAYEVRTPPPSRQSTEKSEGKSEVGDRKAREGGFSTKFGVVLSTFQYNELNMFSILFLFHSSALIYYLLVQIYAV
jgi:hypothetical protein